MQPQNLSARLAICAAASFLLASCGGGGEQLPESAAQALTPQQVTPPSAVEPIDSNRSSPAVTSSTTTHDAPVTTTEFAPAAERSNIASTPPSAETSTAPVTLSSSTALMADPTAHALSIAGAAAATVAAADIVYRASAADLSSYRYAGLQCAGDNHYWWTWGGSAGRYASPLPDPLIVTLPDQSQASSFATVASPGTPGKMAFYFALRNTDVFTPATLTDSKRCEINFNWDELNYPGRTLSRTVGLPMNQDFWWGTSVRLDDWRNTSDKQIVWQWHDHGSTGSRQPLLSLWVQGKQLKLMIAYDMGQQPSDATLTKIWPWTISNWTPQTWMRFVVKARIDKLTPPNSYVKVWLDGRQIVDYHGPIGYPAIAQPDYAKIGIYHWVDAGNAWDNSLPERRAWYNSPILALDNVGYSEASIAALMD